MYQGFLFLLSAACALAELFNNGPAYHRFVEIPVSGDKTQLVDLEATPQWELINNIKRSKEINRYLLFTRQNRDVEQVLKINDVTSIRKSNFDPKVPTAVLIHGWQSQTTYGLGPIVSKALLDKSDVNVILVDWRRIASLDYVSAVAGVPIVGRDVGEFLTFLNIISGAPFSSMHLIGHSLGAHVAGNAGRAIGGRAERLTGLDPAGPKWYLNPYRLSPSDALYVEAIHTNSGIFGIEENVADADFYPNGGSFQPGCFDTSCNHARSYELFAASVTYNNFIGRKCSNLILMRLNLCIGSELPMGNDDLRKTGSGIYRLDTRGKYPY